jgi:AraC-like DNA-binding protein
MKIQVAGPSCAKCQETEKNVRDACTRVGYNKSRFTRFTVILKFRRYFGLVIFS